MTFVNCLALCLAFRFITASVDCVDDRCEDDPIKADLLSWYEKWQEGYRVDYITTNELQESYDFIVIGAGVAGSVVAHRLSMDYSHPKVLLLEAGAQANTAGISSQMVPIHVQLNQLSDIDWQYKSQPSDGFCCDWNNDKRGAIPRGKVVGGSGVLNYMMMVRGHRDDWNKLMNIDGWKWNDVLPYFKKIESLRAYTGSKNATVRGYNGPIIVRSSSDLTDSQNPFDLALINACKAAGIPYLEKGQNNGNNIGIAYSEFNVDDEGHRHHAFIAYNQYMRRKYKDEYEAGLIQLDVLPNAHVAKLVVEERNVVGVEFVDISDDRKQQYTVMLASETYGEVIISAGAFNTPQILMLSGIGPKNELNKHNIAIVKDIPGIGENLQDHVMNKMRYHWKDKYQQHALTMDKITEIMQDFELFGEYLLNGKSYLSFSAATLNGFVKSNYSTKSYPDLQFVFAPGFDGHTEYLNYRDDVYVEHECGDKQLWQDVDNMQNIMVAICLQHPDSIGYVRLKSNDPFDSPLIQPNYLKEQHDVNRLKNGMKIMDNVMNQASMKKLWDFRMDCKKYGDVFKDDDAMEQFIRDSVVTIFHPVGTCKMGDVHQDKMAVVDDQLKVRGITNLRVVDASVLPLLTSGNIQLPVLMIGEKASDLILFDWHSKKNM